MTLLPILTIYALGGIIVNIYAEFVMEGDQKWTIDHRILLFLSWPLYLYALTL